MHDITLKIQEGHLFGNIDGYDWLLDTGAPMSFGRNQSIKIEGQDFLVSSSYMGLTAAQLSEYVDHSTAGIIGADVLNNFDILIDVKSERVSFSTEQIAIDGEALRITDFMGIPIVQANISGADRRMFFDTGAQISYFQDESLDTFPAVGTLTDFYPGIGQFQTNTYRVNATLGNVRYELRCGSLPGILGMTLMMAGTEGIIGNEILHDRVAGYFPRRQMLVLV
jgi:hypothetical protein